MIIDLRYDKDFRYKLCCHGYAKPNMNFSEQQQSI